MGGGSEITRLGERIVTWRTSGQSYHGLWDYAMWRGDVQTQRNPMELV